MTAPLQPIRMAKISVDGLRIGEYTVSEVSDNVSAGYILPADKKVTVKVGENGRNRDA